MIRLKTNKNAHSPFFFKKFNFEKDKIFSCPVSKSTTEKAEVLALSNFSNLKTASYYSFKSFQSFQKGQNLDLPLDLLSYFVQEIRILTSTIEQRKREKALKLKKKGLGKHSLQKSSHFLLSFFKKEDAGLKRTNPFTIYSQKKKNCKKISKKRMVLLNLFKTRRAFKKILERRLLLFQFKIRKKKKYKKVFSFLKKNRRSFKSIFQVYARNFARFKKKKKYRKKVFKRLVWKRKRKIKWKKKGIFRLFRFRLSQKFYVPKHFEINYKTGDIIFLGFMDSQNVDFRLPFWLNLRRLVTFFSS